MKRAARKPDWDAVLAFLPALEAADFVAGAWRSAPGRLPSFDLSPVATRLVEVLHEAGVMYRFDWGAWERRADSLTCDAAAVSRAGIATLRKLLVTHVRQDRFSEGHFGAMLESGHIAAILRRVAELRSRPDRTTSTA